MRVQRCSQRPRRHLLPGECALHTAPAPPRLPERRSVLLLRQQGWHPLQLDCSPLQRNRRPRGMRGRSCNQRPRRHLLPGECALHTAPAPPRLPERRSVLRLRQQGWHLLQLDCSPLQRNRRPRGMRGRSCNQRPRRHLLPGECALHTAPAPPRLPERRSVLRLRQQGWHLLPGECALHIAAAPPRPPKRWYVLRAQALRGCRCRRRLPLPRRRWCCPHCGLLAGARRRSGRNPLPRRSAR